MRSFVRWLIVATLALMLVTSAIAIVATVATVGIVHGGWLDGASWSIDGVDLPSALAGFGVDGFGAVVVGSIVAALLFVGFAIGIVATIGVLASLVLVVPLVSIALLVLVGAAILFGLAPLLVPVLLVVGACVLLVRLFRRTPTRPVDIVPASSPRA